MTEPLPKTSKPHFEATFEKSDREQKLDYCLLTENLVPNVILSDKVS